MTTTTNTTTEYCVTEITRADLLANGWREPAADALLEGWVSMPASRDCYLGQPRNWIVHRPQDRAIDVLTEQGKADWGRSRDDDMLVGPCARRYATEAEARAAIADEARFVAEREAEKAAEKAKAEAEWAAKTPAEQAAILEAAETRRAAEAERATRRADAHRALVGQPHKLNIRLTTAEKARAVAAAEARGESLTHWVRRALAVAAANDEVAAAPTIDAPLVEPLSVNVSAGEHTDLLAAAIRSGLSKSDYLRAVIAARLP